MEASIKTRRDGFVALQLDPEAAQAVFASVLFASKFHDAISPLAKLAKDGLKRQGRETTRKDGNQRCQ
jgi:hypothetical protein